MSRRHRRRRTADFRKPIDAPGGTISWRRDVTSAITWVRPEAGDCAVGRRRRHGGVGAMRRWRVGRQFSSRLPVMGVVDDRWRRDRLNALWWKCFLDRRQRTPTDAARHPRYIVYTQTNTRRLVLLIRSHRVHRRIGGTGGMCRPPKIGKNILGQLSCKIRAFC